MAETALVEAQVGLTSHAAQERLRQVGPNSVSEERPHSLLLFLRKLWAPVPWMLELTLLLELALGKYTQAVIIVALLLLNAALSFTQENRARNALDLLRRRLAVLSRVLRDGCWQMIPARDLVPGDVVRVRVGDLVPADLHLLEGHLLVDQSTLTGESIPAERGPDSSVFAGSVVQRGEATGRITATGQQTNYGKTAELVQAAVAPSNLERVIFALVKYLVAFDVVLVVAVLVYALSHGLPETEIIPFVLILLVASVPVALPATYSLATAFGSHDLARRGVLVTRLSAIEEAAAMDVLCTDKTGTLTQNRLALAALHAYPPHSDEDLLRLAALACEESTQDPIDLAILTAARSRGISVEQSSRIQFIPFDPSTKRSEAKLREGNQILHVIKGAPQVVEGLANGAHDSEPDVDRLARQGFRILAVAAGPEGNLRLVGLVALQDPPREDSKLVVQRLEELGISVLMVTGDGATTAQAIATAVGIRGRTCLPDVLRHGDDSRPRDCGVFAGVLPQDKFHLVGALQRAGHVVGMTGDGVNDAPALKQAEVGIAVANAADVAKAAASLVLTRPGLSDIMAAVETGRCIYQRMLTYTLNKIVKTFQVALFLSLGLLLTGVFVTTPQLILLLLFANDFVTMSLASDRVSSSPKPERWHLRPLVVGGLVLALAWLVFSFTGFFLGREVFHLDLPQVQTLVFLVLVFSGQANVYLVRERGHFWNSLPSRLLIVCSIADVLVVSFLATQGILMAAIGPWLVLGLLLATVVYSAALDLVKFRLLRRFRVA